MCSYFLSENCQCTCSCGQRCTWLQLSIHTLKLFAQFLDSFAVSHCLAMKQFMVDTTNTVSSLHHLDNIRHNFPINALSCSAYITIEMHNKLLWCSLLIRVNKILLTKVSLENQQGIAHMPYIELLKELQMLLQSITVLSFNLVFNVYLQSSIFLDTGIHSDEDSN